LRVRLLIFIFFASQRLFGATEPPPLICASGGAVATIDLEVISPSKSANKPLPMRTINRLEEGDTIRYKPVLRDHEERKGDVTLVLVPADKKAAGRAGLLVFDPRPAAKAQTWKVPWRVSLAALVYGPSGLNVKKVESFLDRDDEMIGELADYADKTAKAEALITALSTPGTSRETMSAALDGFSSKFGASVTVLKPAGTLNQNAMSAFATLDPATASYDPLAGQGTAPVGETAGLATSVAEMFFGTPVGLAAGGTALLMNLGAMAFPKSEFRSTFSQAMPNDEMGLCGKAGPAPLHTRVAFLWAMRVPNVGPPKLAVGKANSLPGAIKSPLPLTGGEADWKYLDRARNWTVQPDRGKAIPVKVQVLANTKSIEVELGKDVKPGQYSLTADWDWDAFEVRGLFDVRPLEDFASVRLTPESQDKLVESNGKVAATLAGSDFEFVTKVEVKKLGDEFATASAVPFVLPQGLRDGVQDHMDIQMNTDALGAGAYRMSISQVDGKEHGVPLKILNLAPVIENLPVMVNQDIPQVSFELRGKRLELLRGIQLSQGSATMGLASADGTRRDVAFKFSKGIAPGTTVSMQALVADRSEPVTIADAARIVGPRPAIAGIELSQMPAQAIAIESGELPAGLALSAMLRVANLPASSEVQLECAGADGAATTAKVEPLTANQLFLTLDTGAWPNGCLVQANIHSSIGDSAPRRIGRIVEMPAIENLAADGSSATLTGRRLETIAKLGWSDSSGVVVGDLPEPLGGDGRQKLQVALPAPPSADAVLYVWLRGDLKARATTVHAN
jgi:hypothetical protein